ncbi:MAG: Gfo/Idh/MocA family oxidoreductase [Bacteroidota bacterium]
MANNGNTYQTTAQMDAFIKNIWDNEMPTASGEEGLIDLQIIDAIKVSIEESRTVEVGY